MFAKSSPGRLSVSMTQTRRARDLSLGKKKYVPDGSSVVSHDTRNLLGCDELLSDLEKLELGLLGEHGNKLETSFNIVKNSESVYRRLLVKALARVSEGNDVHESGREARIGSNRSVDLNEFVHADHRDLSAVQRILQSVTQDQNDGETLSQFVRSRARTRSPRSSHFVEHPMFRRIDTLQMFLRPARLYLRCVVWCIVVIFAWVTFAGREE